MTYGDLPRQPQPGVVLYCRACTATYSAYRGDYFMRLEEKIGRCHACPIQPLLVLAKLHHAPAKIISPEEGEA